MLTYSPTITEDFSDYDRTPYREPPIQWWIADKSSSDFGDYWGLLMNHAWPIEHLSEIRPARNLIDNAPRMWRCIQSAMDLKPDCCAIIMWARFKRCETDMIEEYLHDKIYWNLPWRKSDPYSEWAYLSYDQLGPGNQTRIILRHWKVQFLAIAFFPPHGVKRS
jgi:hypothetical protein